MLHSEIIAVCSEIHTKHISALSGQNVELLNVKRGGTYSNHWALNDQLFVTNFIPTYILALDMSSNYICGTHQR
jgi:hypothetical protein